MRIAFIACVESGNLENQALLLFRSIRKYGGRYKDSPIYSFQPRKGEPLRENTLRIFNELNVEHNTEILNTEFHHYPISNKIFASARAEEILNEDILVFLDSDTAVLNEPASLDISENYAIALRPVDNKNRGSTGPEDKNDVYWQKLYSICGISEAPFVESFVERKLIRAYWNSGLISVRRSEGIFQQWKWNFLKLMEKGHVPDGQITFMDQLSLAATVATLADRIKIPDYRYNYPLPKRPLLAEPYRTVELEDLIHIHYHKWFNKPGFLDMLKPPLNKNSEIYRWISNFLPFQPIIDELLRF